jgi:hypothetical protein
MIRCFSYSQCVYTIAEPDIVAHIFLSFSKNQCSWSIRYCLILRLHYLMLIFISNWDALCLYMFGVGTYIVYQLWYDCHTLLLCSYKWYFLHYARTLKRSALTKKGDAGSLRLRRCVTHYNVIGYAHLRASLISQYRRRTLQTLIYHHVEKTETCDTCCASRIGWLSELLWH